MSSQRNISWSTSDGGAGAEIIQYNTCAPVMIRSFLYPGYHVSIMELLQGYPTHFTQGPLLQNDRRPGGRYDRAGAVPVQWERRACRRHQWTCCRCPSWTSYGRRPYAGWSAYRVFGPGRCRSGPCLTARWCTGSFCCAGVARSHCGSLFNRGKIS